MSPETRYKIEELEQLTGLSRRLVYDYIARDLVHGRIGGRELTLERSGVRSTFSGDGFRIELEEADPLAHLGVARVLLRARQTVLVLDGHAALVEDGADGVQHQGPVALHNEGIVGSHGHFTASGFLDPADLRRLVRHLRRQSVLLLAEKVETIEEFENCRALGFDRFQGYYFAKPVVLEGVDIDASKATLLRLLHLVTGAGNTEEIVNAFKEDAKLGLNLLRLVNTKPSASAPV